MMVRRANLYAKAIVAGAVIAVVAAIYGLWLLGRSGFKHAPPVDQFLGGIMVMIFLAFFLLMIYVAIASVCVFSMRLWEECGKIWKELKIWNEAVSRHGGLVRHVRVERQRRRARWGY